MPLWAQLESDLQHRLDADEFDERFPTDQELVEQYDVSRHTVREAVRHLNRTGVLRRERGRGTVVNRTEFEQSLGALYSLFRSIESSGVEQRSEVLDLKTVVDPAVCAHLGVDPATDLVYLERIRFAGDTPLAVDRAWLPAEIASPLLDVDFTHTALYDQLDAAGAHVGIAGQPVNEMSAEHFALCPVSGFRPERGEGLNPATEVEPVVVRCGTHRFDLVGGERDRHSVGDAVFGRCCYRYEITSDGGFEVVAGNVKIVEVWYAEIKRRDPRPE